MNSRERVLTSLAWQEPDRVPIQIYLTPEIAGKLADRFKGRDLLEVFGVDFRHVGAAWRGTVKPPQGEVYYDIWGVGYKNQRYEFGTYPEAYDLSLARIETMDDFVRYPWPSVDDFDVSKVWERCDAIKDYSVCCGGAGHPDIINGVSRGRGMQRVIEDIMLEDEVGIAIIDRRVDFCYRELERILEAGRGKIDIVCLGEDCGTQNGRLFSQKVFDDFFRPRLKRFYDLAHRYGAKAMMHSCGDTHEIMPTFIEMGLDVLDAMQPEPPGMQPEAIRKACFGKLAFCGLISTQQTLPRGTVEECRVEARHRLDVIAKGGGYIFAPAHCIQPDTPVENILAVFEQALGRPLE
ncbi:MAG TPA: uroporphyrinogen decarboxylase family protein [bacterium]|nr:uroporphyrinogen decarboxylase family protein [bacterium]